MHRNPHVWGHLPPPWPALVHIVVLPGGFHRSGNLGLVVLFVVHLLQGDFHLGPSPMAVSDFPSPKNSGR